MINLYNFIDEISWWDNMTPSTKLRSELFWYSISTDNSGLQYFLEDLGYHKND